MKLIRLDLKDFKGTRDLTLEANGSDVSVFARNGRGKTTLADAYYFLLFGKDSLGREKFGIKTLDDKNEPIHFLEHTATAVFELDGGEIVELMKIYKEKWTTTRGKSEQEFDGHEVLHYRNGVPVAENKYKDYVAGLCPNEQIFRSITSATYFNEVLKWDDRRRILIEVCGDVSDADVVSSNSGLARFPAMLGNHTIDEYRTMVTAKRKKVNADRGLLPARIDEVNRSLKDGADEKVPDMDPLRAEVRRLGESRARINAGGEIAEKTGRLRFLEAEASEIATRVKVEANKAFDQAQVELRRANGEVSRVESESSTLTHQLEADQSALTSMVSQINDKIAEHKAESAKVLEYSGPESCAACGQALPADRVADAKRKAEDAFNERKATNLERLVVEGRALRTKSTSLENKIAEKKADIASLSAQTQSLTATRDALRERAAGLESPQIDLEADPVYKANQEKQDALRLQIAELRKGAETALAEIDKQIAEANAKVSAAESVIARILQRKQSQGRIEELKTEEKKLAKEIEQIDADLFLTEEFIRAKVRLLTERIDSRFSLVKWKLFETQVNGGLSECCIALVNGVPYSIGLNTGACMRASLDICNTLSQHYGIVAPIFVDRAESLTEDFPTFGQQIRLEASKPDNELRIVIHDRAQAQEAIAV